MWPFLLVYGALSLPSLAQVYQSVTIRSLIPPGNYIGIGKFIAGQIENVYGFVRYCDDCENIDHSHTPWMLLTSLSRCSLENKLKIALENKAAAVIVIADEFVENVLQTSYYIMKSTLERKYGHARMDMPVILVSKENGEKLVAIAQISNNVPVILELKNQDCYQRTSLMVIVSVCLAVVMALGVCYALYSHKEVEAPIIRACPFQIAVSKIPTKKLTDAEDPVCDNEMKCAICLEGFQVKEVISYLPCKHVFHKDCIEPWLIERRLCPMCKMDVVRFYGHVNLGSEESIVDMPLDERITVNANLESDESMVDVQLDDSVSVSTTADGEILID